MEISDGVRQRLALLLAGENLDSPQQLLAFDDSITKSASSWERFQASNQVVRDRKTRYREYDRMDEQSSDIHASLDAYAEEATIRNREKERTVWVHSDNSALVDQLHELFDRLRIEDSIYAITRGVAKYGDDFERIYYDETGVFHWAFTDPWLIDRELDDHDRLRGYTVSGVTGMTGTSTTQATANPWDYVHFKIHGSDRKGWGESLLSGLQRTWRILDQLETALALYRLHRAADRIVFYVDVGAASQDQAYDIVNRWKQIYRKRKWFDPKTNEVDFKHNPVDILEDIFWPVRKDSESKVDKLQGSNNIGDIADIDMWRNKLRYGLRIPKGYWGDDDGGNFDAKAGLVQQDMKFARGVERLQRSIIGGLTKLAQIHLALLKLNTSAARFKIRMEPVSYLMEMQRMEALQQRVVVLQGLVEIGQGLGLDPEAWSEYLLKSVMFTTDDEFQDFMNSQVAAVAQKQSDQTDMEQQASDNELKGQDLDNKGRQKEFADAKKDGGKGKTASPAAKGGNVSVNVHVNSRKKSAKAPKKKARLADGMSTPDSLTEDELSALQDYLRDHKKELREIKASIERLEEDGVVVNLDQARLGR